MGSQAGVITIVSGGLHESAFRLGDHFMTERKAGKLRLCGLHVIEMATYDHLPALPTTFPTFALLPKTLSLFTPPSGIITIFT